MNVDSRVVITGGNDPSFPIHYELHLKAEKGPQMVFRIVIDDTEIGQMNQQTMKEYAALNGICYMKDD